MISIETIEKSLDSSIEKCKQENDSIKKEELFQEVMKQAWAVSSAWSERDPDEIRQHPREHDYRLLCGIRHPEDIKWDEWMTEIQLEGRSCYDK